MALVVCTVVALISTPVVSATAVHHTTDERRTDDPFLDPLADLLDQFESTSDEDDDGGPGKKNKPDKKGKPDHAQNDDEDDDRDDDDADSSDEDDEDDSSEDDDEDDSSEDDDEDDSSEDDDDADSSDDDDDSSEDDDDADSSDEDDDDADSSEDDDDADSSDEDDDADSSDEDDDADSSDEDNDDADSSEDDDDADSSDEDNDDADADSSDEDDDDADSSEDDSDGSSSNGEDTADSGDDSQLASEDDGADDEDEQSDADTQSSDGGSESTGTDSSSGEDSSQTSEDLQSQEVYGFDVYGIEIDKRELTTNESITVSVTVEKIGPYSDPYEATLEVDGDEVASERRLIESGEQARFSFSTTFNEPGTYDIAIADTSAGNVTVQPVTEPKSETPPTLAVTQSERDDGRRLFVQHARVSSNLSFAPNWSSGGNATQLLLSNISLDLASNQSAFVVDVSTTSETPREYPAVPLGAPLGYTPVRTNLSDEATGSVTYGVTIPATALPQDRGSESVRIYSYQNDEWVPLETTYDATSDRYRATAETVAPIAAVTLDPGRIELIDVTSPPDWVRKGFETTVRATVENPGDRPAVRTLTVAVDGEQITTETVRLAPGEQTTVPISFSAAAGMVTVDGVEAGLLRTSRENESSGGVPDSQPDGGTRDIPMIVVTVLLVTVCLSIIGVYLTGYRQ